MSNDDVLAEVRAKLAQVVGLEECRTAGARSAKLQVMALIADKAALLPRSGIAQVLEKPKSWVNFAIARGEQRLANDTFRRQVEKALAAVKSD